MWIMIECILDELKISISEREYYFLIKRRGIIRIFECCNGRGWRRCVKFVKFERKRILFSLGYVKYNKRSIPFFQFQIYRFEMKLKKKDNSEYETSSAHIINYEYVLYIR